MVLATSRILKRKSAIQMNLKMFVFITIYKIINYKFTFISCTYSIIPVLTVNLKWQKFDLF